MNDFDLLNLEFTTAFGTLVFTDCTDDLYRAFLGYFQTLFPRFRADIFFEQDGLNESGASRTIIKRSRPLCVLLYNQPETDTSLPICCEAESM